MSTVEQRILAGGEPVDPQPTSVEVDVEQEEAALETDEKLHCLRKVLETSMDQLDACCDGDYTIIGDNIDLLVKTIGTSKSKKNKFYHWFHLIGLYILIHG